MYTALIIDLKSNEHWFRKDFHHELLVKVCTFLTKHLDNEFEVGNMSTASFDEFDEIIFVARQNGFKIFLSPKL